MRQVRVWLAMEALQQCFECTDWDMFKAAATDKHYTWVDEYTESVSAYIQTCMEDVSVIKNISTRADEKLWMTSEVQAVLKAWNTAFESGHMVALRTARANLNRAMRVAKRAHGQKVQDFFHDPMNTGQMWVFESSQTIKLLLPPARTTSTFTTISVTSLGGSRHSTPLLRGNLFLAWMSSH